MQYRITAKMTKLDPARELVHLVVDYENAAEFLADYDESISTGTALFETDKPLDDGAFVTVRISFPGLVGPVAIDGIARRVDGEANIRVQLRQDASASQVVERIRNGDPRVVLPVLKILIVEDNAHVAELVGNGLAASARRELGHVVLTFVTAGDGVAALEALKRTTFDAAIIDVYLPILDGPALIRQARTTLGLVDLPIITMSGGGEPARKAALRAGATAFLDKPVRLKQVVETMRQLVKVQPNER